MSAENEEFLFTTHFLLAARVTALGELFLSYIAHTTRRDIAVLREEWEISSRDGFLAMMDAVDESGIEGSLAPVTKMRQIAQSIWNDSDKRSAQ